MNLVPDGTSELSDEDAKLITDDYDV